MSVKRNGIFKHLRIFTSVMVGFLLLSHVSLMQQAHADDLDIYINPSVPSGAEPLVMFSLDYRSNLGSTACNGNECDTLIAEGYLPATGPYTFFDVLQGALKKVFDPLTGVKVGFMMNHDHRNNCEGPSQTGCSNGGYILSGFNTFDASDSNGAKLALYNQLAAIPTPQGNVSHSYQGKELFFEFFRYLTGQDVYNAHNGWTDYGTNNQDNLPIDNPAISWDTAIENGTTYTSPLAGALACSKIFTVNLMFQVSNQEDDSDSAITDTKANGGMSSLNLSGNNNNFDTVIRYLKDVDLGDGSFGTIADLEGIQNVLSYFLVDPTKINNTTNGYATAGGTGNALELSTNPDELVTTLNNIFTSILSVSSTFVSPTVPVSVLNRTQTEDEVYLAMFQPDENGLPLWTGNLKKLAIGQNISGDDELQDVNGINAIDIDGRIRNDALTFWTDAGALPPADTNNNEVTGKDGNFMTRGGAGQKIPGYIAGAPGILNSDGARQLFTEDPLDVTDGLMPLDANTTTADALWTELTAKWSPAASSATYGSATSAEQDLALDLLEFARGYQDDGATVRGWIMGDPLHSAPIAVNYGARGSFTTTNPDIRILFGTNDGYFRMVQNKTSGGSELGAENWAFMPRSVMEDLDRLHSNLGSTPIHPITVDGPPDVYIVDSNNDGSLVSSDGDIVYAFFGLRRGGKEIYALDISDPDAPEFLWSLSKGAAGTDFAELGQTWSKTSVGKIKDASNNVIPVLIFGGGYNGDDEGDDLGDLGKDAASHVIPQPVGTDDDEGNAIFVVNANTGALIWKAVEGGTAGYNSGSKAYREPNLKDSFAADVTAFDSDGDGITDRVYAGDTGGRVWRVDLAGADVNDVDSDGNTTEIITVDPAVWQVNMLLSIGRHESGFNNVTNDRRFIVAPDVILSRDILGPFDGVIIGSGDRENPNATSTEDWFYLVKDRAVNSGLPSATVYGHDNISAGVDVELADLTSNCLQDNSCGSSPDLSHGWRIQLTDSGEKTASQSVTSGGTIFFTTFKPGSGLTSCSPSEGTGFLYAISAKDATAVYDLDISNNIGTVVLDRKIALERGGIPTTPVVLGNGRLLVQGRGPNDVIMDIGTRTSFPTFWNEYDR